MTPPFDIVHADTSTLIRPAWLALRKGGLGSSDAAPAMGMSPWTSAYSLWAEKRGLLAETPDNERFLWGRLHEPLILAEAARRDWLRGQVDQHLMLRSKEFPWLLANPDGMTDRVVVESKTADGWDEARWDAGVPDHYVIQGHELMIVTGRHECVFPVLFGGNNLRCFIVEYDPELGSTIIEATERMWERILSNDPPDPDGSEATMLALRQVYTEVTTGKIVDLPDSFVDRISARRVALDIMAGHKTGIDQVKAELMEAMGDGETGQIFGETVCTWRANKNGVRTFLFKESK